MGIDRGIMRRLAIALVLSAIGSASGQRNKYQPVVSAPSGTYVGITVQNSEYGANFHHFLGIRYAEPPVGYLRFRDPVPLQLHSGQVPGGFRPIDHENRPKPPPYDPYGAKSVLQNATSFGASCPQMFLRPTVVGEEDCLFLNVFTPSLPHSHNPYNYAKPLPVMVFLHGGSFIANDGRIDPAPLLAKGVVVVSINYRLGPLGFLTLGEDPYVAGNQGLKDQLLAMRWVKENVASFGGDPNRVTLMGQSAGAIAANLHQISPKGLGLYQRVLLQSGSALINVEAMRKRVPQRSSERFIRDVGCGYGYDQLKCLQSIPVEKLIQKAMELCLGCGNVGPSLAAEREGGGPYLFWPSIDPQSADPFMPYNPLSALSSGSQKDVPVVAGTVRDEGTLIVALAYNQLNEIDQQWNSYLPSVVSATRADEENKLDNVRAQAVRQFYLGDKEIDEDSRQELVDAMGDGFITSPVYKAVQLMAKTQKSPVYLYRFTHEPSRSFSERFGAASGAADVDFGVSHSDELLLLFKDPAGLNGSVTTEEDRNAQNVITSLWTSFAQSGYPTLTQHPIPSPTHGILPYGYPPTPTYGAQGIWSPFQVCFMYNDVSAGIKVCSYAQPYEDNYLDINSESSPQSGFLPARMFFWQRTFWQDAEAALIYKPAPKPFKQ